MPLASASGFSLFQEGCDRSLVDASLSKRDVDKRFVFKLNPAAAGMDPVDTLMTGIDLERQAVATLREKGERTMKGTIWYWLDPEKNGVDVKALQEAPNRKTQSYTFWMLQFIHDHPILSKITGVIIDPDHSPPIVVQREMTLSPSEPSLVLPNGVKVSGVSHVTCRLHFCTSPGVDRKVGAYRKKCADGNASATLEWQNKEGGRYEFAGRADTLDALSELFFAILEGTIAPHSDWSKPQVEAKEPETEPART